MNWLNRAYRGPISPQINLNVTNASAHTPNLRCQSIQSPPNLTVTTAPITQKASAQWNKRVGRSQIRIGGLVG